MLLIALEPPMPTVSSVHPSVSLVFACACTCVPYLRQRERDIHICGRPKPKHSPTARAPCTRSRRESSAQYAQLSKKGKTPTSDWMKSKARARPIAGRQTCDASSTLRPTKPLRKIGHTKAQVTATRTDRLTSPPMTGGFAAPAAGINPSRSNHTVRRTQGTMSMNSYQCWPVKRGRECDLPKSLIPSPTNSDEG